MYTKKKCKIYVLSVLLCTFFFSCSSIDFELPQGPQGTNGKSAYEIWKEEVETGHINWPSTQVDLADFLVYIKGEKGDKGKDGMSAYDQWKILITQGNVTNPHDPSLIWPSSKNTEADFWDFLSGRDGESPHIGENGNWYIGNKDTKIKAIGKDGKDGINGKDGFSAYELWKQSVAGGNINWPKDQTTMEHFFLYLKGKDGENGITPHVGENGKVLRNKLTPLQIVITNGYTCSIFQVAKIAKKGVWLCSLFFKTIFRLIIDEVCIISTRYSASFS